MGFSAAVICREAFMREAVIEAIEASGTRVVASMKYVGQEPSEQIDCDVGVYVASGHSERNTDRDATALENMPLYNWLVLCESPQNPVYQALKALNRCVSAAPLDLARDDLAHLVPLAARGNSLVMNSLCDAGAPTALQSIQEASLDPEQWQLLRYLAAGYSNKVIARLQEMDEAVVKARIRTLLAKLKVKNRTQAAVLAAKSGLTG